METITLNDINTETKEGQLLIAALSMISVESRIYSEPDEIIDAVNQIRIGIYGVNTIY